MGLFRLSIVMYRFCRFPIHIFKTCIIFGKTLSNVLVQGLIGNIHLAHEKGFRDSAEHLRWIISELERGFIEVTNVQQSNFKQL